MPKYSEYFLSTPEPKETSTGMDSQTEKNEKGSVPIGLPEEEEKNPAKEGKTKIDNAKKELRDLLAAKEKDKDQSYYAMAGELYREITGEDLEYAARKVSQAEARSLGNRVLSKKEYLNETNIKSAQKWAFKEEKGDYWANLKPEEKKQIEEKYGNFDRYVGVKAQELEKKTGLSFSEDTVFEMLSRGIEVDKIKKTGWFFKKIKIPTLGTKMSEAEFKKWANKMGDDIKERTNDKGIKELERIIGVGEEKARKRREKHMMEIIQKAAEEEKPKISSEQIETQRRLQDLSDLRKMKTGLPEFLEKLASKRKKIHSSYKEGKITEKQPEPLSDRELGYFKKLGLFAMDETGEVGVRKIAAAGKILEKRLEEITKKRKLGHSFSEEDFKFVSGLKEFIAE